MSQVVGGALRAPVAVVARVVVGARVIVRGGEACCRNAPGPVAPATPPAAPASPTTPCDAASAAPASPSAEGEAASAAPPATSKTPAAKATAAASSRRLIRQSNEKQDHTSDKDRDPTHGCLHEIILPKYGLHFLLQGAARQNPNTARDHSAESGRHRGSLDLEEVPFVDQMLGARPSDDQQPPHGFSNRVRTVASAELSFGLSKMTSHGFRAQSQQVRNFFVRPAVGRMPQDR
jgi:hypothetical protein